MIGSTSGTGNIDIDGYTWNAPVTFQSSTGNLIFESGTHSSGGNAFLADTGGNITLASGAAVASTASGNAVVLAAGGNVVNNSGSSSPLSASSGRWIVYSTKASSDTNGASVMNPAQTIYNETYASEAPGSVPNAGQNTWLYGTGLITITATGQTVTYGTAPNTSAVLNTTYSFSCSNGCSSSVLTGGPTLTISGSNGTSTSGNYNAGSWTITPSGVTVSNGDSISYVTGTLTVNAKGLTLSGFAASGKTYDGTTAATISSNGSLSGVVGSDSVSLNSGGASATFDNANVGTTHTVTGSGYALSSGNGNNDANNYTLTQPTATNVTISVRGLTITASNVSGTYGTSGANTLNGTTGFAASGLVNGQTVGSVTLATNASSSTSGNYNANTGGNPASWTITASAATGGTFNAGNYTITYDTGTQTITPAALTIAGMTAAGKTYDASTTATVNNSADTLSGVVSGHNNGGGTSDVVTLGGTGNTSGTFSSANAGTWTVTGSGLSISGADAGNYTIAAQPTASANITAPPPSRGGIMLPPTTPVTQPSAPVAPVVSNPAPATAPSVALVLPGTVQQETTVTTSVTDALSPKLQVPADDGIQLASYYSLMQLGDIPVTPALVHNATPSNIPDAPTSNETVTEPQAQPNSPVTLSHPGSGITPLYDPMYDNQDVQIPTSKVKSNAPSTQNEDSKQKKEKARSVMREKLRDRLERIARAWNAMRSRGQTASRFDFRPDNG